MNAVPEYKRNIPVLTLHQPWASWIVAGWKTGETRTSSRVLKMLDGRFFYVHAGQAWDSTAIDTAHEWLKPEQVATTHREIFPLRGQVLALVLGGKLRPMEERDEPLGLIGSTWTPDRYAVPARRYPRWFLPIERVDALDNPIPAKGQQGLWYIR